MNPLKILLFLGVLIQTHCLASSPFESLKFTFQQCQTLVAFQKSLDTTFRDFWIDRKEERFQRPLDFKHVQSVYEIRIRSEANSVASFKVFLVTDSIGHIILGALQQSTHLECFRKEDRSIETYLALHNTFYNGQKQPQDFITQLTDLTIYGFGCSDSGTYNPPNAKQMLQYVEAQNYEPLAAWLKEISPELQAYAIQGLLTLERKKRTIQPMERKIILHLTQRNSEIYHCSGCLYGLTTTIQTLIQEAVSESNE